MNCTRYRYKRGELNEVTKPGKPASGLPNGLLNASSLAPLTTTELEITLESAP
jgi:hypothetical protein